MGESATPAVIHDVYERNFGCPLFTMLLPHTPLDACGINASSVLVTNSMEDWHKIGHTLAPKDPVWNEIGKEPGMQRLEIKYLAKDEDFPGELNVSVRPIGSLKVEIKVNKHFDLRKLADTGDGLNRSSVIQRFIKNKFSDAIDNRDQIASLISRKILS